ncbi:hypothetical protein N7492_000997 [Penicillium capsulatum]|uniref:HECT-type E3 ubiquitin transferase n=1 Tax=Penicillium capsulatum TaxID=69766 RepID=A0A9W9ITW0_9EURO|nr:hypothetical protein N7492_000997 [Penicillium capsulatum]
MSSRPGRNPPIPPSLNPGFDTLPSNPASLPRPEHRLRRPIQPQNASTMAPMKSTGLNNPTRRGHHRSISHPFVFPTTKSGKQAGPQNTTWDSDSDSDDVTYPIQNLANSPRKELSKKGPGNDVAEGKCQTCNSVVRWPRNSNVFRCTACLMVTDIQPEFSKDGKDPIDPELEDRNRPWDGSTAQAPPGPSIGQMRPETVMSASRLGGMINGDLSSYFDSLLDDHSLWPSLDDNRIGRARPQNGEGTVFAPRSDYLSVPRDPRSRSTSASSDRERVDGTKENTTHLIPPKDQWEGKDMSSRSRANSDVQSRSKQGRRPQETPRPADRKPQDAEHRILQWQPPRMKLDPSMTKKTEIDSAVFEPDAKTLLLGDVAENSTWWMHELAQAEGQIPSAPKEKDLQGPRLVSSRSPRINWTEVNQWYHLIFTAGSNWVEQWTAKKLDPARSERDRTRSRRWELIDLSMIDKEIIASRLHLQRTLLKATENLLKRPRCIMKKPEDTRWLFILLANPLLSSPGAYSELKTNQASSRNGRRPSHPKDSPRATTRDGKSHKNSPVEAVHSNNTDHHYGLLKRILGLMGNQSNECHHYFVSWFARFSPTQLERLVELVGGFVTYRLTRQHGRKRSEVNKDGNELIPSFASAGGNTPAALHASLNRRSPPKQKEAPMVYEEDWQIRAASRIMSLLFTANVSHASRKTDTAPSDAKARRFIEHTGNHGSVFPISSFYNTLLDYSDLLADFEIWESRSSKFSFCRYPFFLSIWAKIHILEHDARRQMEVKAREAFFNSILNHRAVSQYLVLKVRRECLVEDSLRGVSEVVGTGQEEIKKGLRIEFLGEEGIDAGGLRKEWFLLLVREVFDPYHGLFIYDDDSQYCYFNPYCFESSEQFFLVGVLLGLAIYNSTILDVDLPPFAFRKLLASAPQTNAPPSAIATRPKFKCALEDLAEYRPALARGLKILLDYEGDVAETFCYDFVAQMDRYGEVVNVPLCPGGGSRPVTNKNRREFVDLYIHYLLDTSVARQFEPFKRGFFTVCGGNALSLFRPEEIELLVRGSDEPLDVTSLRAVATYDNWSHPRPESLPVVQWFWDFFETSPPQAQRKILSFITGSDRIPAMGATSLSIRIACIGDDCLRYPIARTCFNTLSLYRYAAQDKFRRLLWDAVVNSEGFGLK